MKKEDEQRLWPDSQGRAVVLGAVHLMKQWPGREELLAAACASCLLSLVLLTLVLLPAILAYGPISTCRFLRKASITGNEKLANVYFLKHENRTWTSDELCNIETAARLHPEYNIFTINLLNRRNVKLGKKSSIRYGISDLPYGNRSEDRIRCELAEVLDVVNVDVEVDRFFAGSILSRRLSNLSRDEIELAAKFQVIWDSPGIALEPAYVHQLYSVGHLFNKSQTDLIAGVQIDGDIQASSAACQSFIGQVVGEVARSRTPRRTLLRRALVDFCSSFSQCTGVQIIQPVFGDRQNFTDCPIVKTIIEDNKNVKNNNTR